MKNAIIPVVIFSMATAGLFWAEAKVDVSSSYRQSISVKRLEQEHYESNDTEFEGTKEYLSSRQKLMSRLSWVSKIKGKESLLKSRRYLSLAKDEQLMAKFLLAKHFLKDNPVESTLLIESFSESEKNRNSAHFTLALAYSRLGRTSEAIIVYREALRLNPNHQAASINLGLLLKRQGLYKEAIDVLDYAVKISGGERLAKALSLRAASKQAVADYEGAKNDYQKSIEYRPNNAGSWLGLAKMQSKVGTPYSQVVTTFQRASRLSAEHYKPLAELGKFQLDKLDFPGAVKSLSAAAKLSPFQPNVRRSLAWAFFENGQQSQSIKHWAWLAKNEKRKYRRKFANFMVDLIESDRERVDSVRFATESVLSRNKISEALKNEYEYLWLLSVLHLENLSSNELEVLLSLKQGGGVNIEANRVKWRLVKKFYESGKLTRVTEYLTQLADRQVSPSLVEFKLSEVYKQLNQLNKADQYIKLALNNEPENIEFLIHKTWLDIERGLFATAASNLVTLKTQGAQEESLHQLEAEIAWRNSEWSKASEHYSQLLILDKNNYQALYRIAAISHIQGDINAATEKLNDALKLNSEMIPARVLLARILCDQGDREGCHFEAKKVLKLDRDHTFAKNLIKI